MRGGQISSSGPNTLVSTAAFDVPDDILFTLGDGSDIAVLLCSAGLAANTALTGVLIGTPVTPILDANSLIIANSTANGDILIAGNDGGHSRVALFFDASAPNTYLYNVGGTWTAGATAWQIPAVTISGLVTSTSDTGFATTATFVPDASRLDYVYSMGNRVAELTVNLANAGSQHLELFQANVNLTCASTGPTDASTVALMRLRATHDTTDMTYLRLRGLNTYLDVRKNLQDAYGHIAGIDFYTNAVAVGGEAAVGVFNMECNSAVTGNVRGAIINVYGAGTPSTTSIGLEVRTDGGTAVLAEGIRVWSVGGNSITTGINLAGTITNDISFQQGTTLTDDGTNLTLTGANLALTDVAIVNLKAGTSSINPEVAHRGQFYFTEGASGVADLLYCIMKGTGDAYSAIQVAIG